MIFNEKLFKGILEQVKARSNNGKPTRRQVSIALHILADEGGYMTGLPDLGIREEDIKALGYGAKPHGRLLAVQILTCAIFGDELSDFVREDDDEQDD